LAVRNGNIVRDFQDGLYVLDASDLAVDDFLFL